MTVRPRAETVDAMGNVRVCHLVIQICTSEIQGALQAFVTAKGRFDRRNVTEYLRRFEVAMKPLRLADADVALQFELTVHEDLDEQVRELTMGMTWVRAKERLREAFRRFDETRVTVERFVAWIDGPKDWGDPDDILRGFDRRYGDLDTTERAYFAEKTVWLLRAMLTAIRREAAKTLREGDALTADWLRVSEVIRNMAKVTRVVRRVEKAPRSSVVEVAANRLLLNFIAAIERMQSAAGPTVPARLLRREGNGLVRPEYACSAIRRATSGVTARTCGRPSTGEKCELTTAALFAGRILDRSRSFARAPGGCGRYYRPSETREHYAIRLGEPEFGVRVQTVTVNEKRARPVGDDAAALKRPRQGAHVVTEGKGRQANGGGRSPPGFWEPASAIGKGSASKPPLAPGESDAVGVAGVSAPTEKDKSAKPAYMLQVPVRKKDPEQLAVDAVLNATATVDVTTLLNVVPISMLQAINQQLRTKRVAVQATRLEKDRTDTSTDGADERQDLDFDVIQLPEVNAVPVGGGPSVGRVHAARVPGPEPSSEIEKGAWAWSCPQVEVFIPSLGRAVRALINSGSKITVADAQLAAEANWLYDPRPIWQIRICEGPVSTSVSKSVTSTEVNLFIQDALGYPLILGQTWLMSARLGMQSQPDGTEVAWISSADEKKMRCWVAVGSCNARNAGRAGIDASHGAAIDVGDDGDREDFQ
ncbi:MAG: hypothetical protein BJ554DRAFT_5277, partial [Olpidium bornovanus]